MPAPAERRTGAAAAPDLAALERVSEAVESGAGLPDVARAASRALGASVIVLDSSSSVLAVACASSEDERAVMSGEGGTETVDLRVADSPVGTLRYRPRGDSPPNALLRMVAALIALEVERARAPDRASEAAVQSFLEDLLARRLTDRENIVARAAEIGCDLAEGTSVLVVRARPRQPEEGDWRGRVLTIAERAARAVERGSLAALLTIGAVEPELVLIVPGDGVAARRVATALERELAASLPNYVFVVARSRPTGDPADLHRAGAESLLAANVAEARGQASLSFEDTGAYRLLLPAMSEDPSELQRFYQETVAPLVEYDEQYETELVRTLDTFFDTDASVAGTAERLFTHRHTIRYRLDRVRDLTGLDVSSSDGRERLSLGLKAMQVLGIVPPGGPAHEPGAEGGRVPKEEKDR
jgi:sugar diacid utilization regulator